MSKCEYYRKCALYEFSSFRCDWFKGFKCQYRHEFQWYDHATVTEHTDRIRMERVNELEKEAGVLGN
jgi:hypothetical protein